MRTEITRNDDPVISGTWIATREERARNDRWHLEELIAADILGDRDGSVVIFHADGRAISDDMPSEGTFLAIATT